MQDHDQTFKAFIGSPSSVQERMGLIAQMQWITQELARTQERDDLDESFRLLEAGIPILHRQGKISEAQAWQDRADKLGSQVLRKRICDSCQRKGIVPQNAFIVAKFTPQPQGPLVNAFSNRGDAHSYADSLRKIGNTDIYIMSPNPQHDLIRMTEENPVTAALGRSLSSPQNV